MEGDFIKKKCCGETFGHSRMCVHYRDRSQERQQVENKVHSATADLRAENEALRKENRILRTTMLKYADRGNWSHVDGWPQAFDLSLSGYSLAKQALKSIKRVKK